MATAMAPSLASCRSCRAAPFRGVRSRVQVSCSAGHQIQGAVTEKKQQVADWKLLAVGLAAATSLAHAAPAEAGVVFVKPERRKLFQTDPSQVVKQASTPKEKSSGPSFSAPSFSAPSIGVEGASIALPATIVLLGAAALAIPKLDAGFGEFFSDTIVKNSNKDGAGYETYKTQGLPAAVKQAQKQVKKAGKKAKRGLFG